MAALFRAISSGGVAAERRQWFFGSNAWHSAASMLAWMWLALGGVSIPWCIGGGFHVFTPFSHAHTAPPQRSVLALVVDHLPLAFRAVLDGYACVARAYHVSKRFALC